MSDNDFRYKFGLKCPHCGSDDIDGDGLRKQDGFEATETCRCRKCDNDWEVHYMLILAGYVAIGDDGKVIDHKPNDLTIEDARQKAADKAWDEAPNKLFQEAKEIEPEGWGHVSDEPRWIRPFYYYGGRSDPDSSKATFIVIFKENSTKVAERYINW